MKKIYLNPEIVVVKLQTTKMLAASPGSQELTTDEYIENGNDIGGRGSDWDED